jgi:hypothetical protein
MAPVFRELQPSSEAIAFIKKESSMIRNDTIGRLASWHLIFGLTFAVLGMCLGIYMATSQDHGQHVTHAHILLLGFVVSVLYAAIYHIWLAGTASRLAVVQTALHEVGASVLAVGLLLLFGGVAPEAKLEPLLATGSLCALGGALLMLYQVVAATRSHKLPSVATMAGPQPGT